MFSFPKAESTSSGKKVTTTISTQPTAGKLPKPSYRHMEYKKLLISENEEKIELAAKRAIIYDASSERKSESGNKNNITQSTRPQTGSLITIISITIWVVFIQKTEITIHTTTAITDASTTESTMFTTSTTKTSIHITSTIESTMFTTSTTETTMLTTSTNSRSTTMNGPKFNKWKQNAITVAGGNGPGQKLNLVLNLVKKFSNIYFNLFKK
ncbi:unnamed protein product [Adineta steineri]|uniref:Uncharacterized protein n=1 Tax=Adineta steineri TaxID=433720 RepID=A0A815L054_9BILA|nr:unnamed protein product [Adineta steineri]CAF3895175.1 unnamed protein product [Adineta steineri]